MRFVSFDDSYQSELKGITMACVTDNAGGCHTDPHPYSQLSEYIDSLRINPYSLRRKDTLIGTLHKAQTILGYLPAEAQKQIAKSYNISHAEVSGIVSFYNHFTTQPKGEIRISVCMGTACYVTGADKVLLEFERVLGICSGEVTQDGKFSLDSLRCVGACGLAPVVTINDKVYGKVTTAKVKKIIEDYLIESNEPPMEVVDV